MRASRSCRVSAALSLAMLAALMVGLHKWTAGFEIWTFEGRRELQLREGTITAQKVPLLSTGTPPQWGTDEAAGAYLVDFFYTRCPSVCRVLGSEYQQMQRQLAAQPAALSTNVRLVSVSFDLAHDTPAQLAAYAAAQHADPRWWTIAVPTGEPHAQKLLRSLGVVVVPDGQGGFVHNGDIHLLDGAGRLRGLYAFDVWPQALAAARALAAAPPQAP